CSWRARAAARSQSQQPASSRPPEDAGGAEDQNPPYDGRAILRQSSAMTQSPHRGCRGLQTFCPQVTRYKLISGHQRRSVDLYSACSVSSGCAVRTHPIRVEMRCTWVSTQMLLPLLNARIITRFAVL